MPDSAGIGVTQDHQVTYSHDNRMSRAEQARSIVQITKSLKAFSGDEALIVRYFAATRISGRAGLFASSIRGYSSKTSSLSPGQMEALYNDAGLDVFGFERDIRPWLLRNSLAYFDTNSEIEEILVSTILTYDALLEAVVELFEFLEPKKDVERACQLLVHMASEMPLRESEALETLSGTYGEQTARLAVDLARGHKLVSTNKPWATSELILYCERVWKTAIAKAAKALARLSAADRAPIEQMVESVRDYQGYPEQLLRKWAKANNVEKLLDLAIGVGLIVKTGVQVGGGHKAYFLTTPHFYADVEDEFGEDVCDRVKIFIDSIRHGQHFSEQSRGRIWDPSLLLKALINRGVVGPATAIGQDYTMAERAGIIQVERSLYAPGQYHMILRQTDVAKKTLEVIDRQVMTPTIRILLPKDFKDSGRFISTPEVRVKLAELPGEMAEVEQDFLNTLREN